MGEIQLHVAKKPGLLRTLASALASRGSLAQALGKTFGGDRDLNTALGYQPTLGPNEYWARYKRNAVAARVVEAYPLGTWRGVGELIEVEDPEKTTEFEREWSKLSVRLKIWPNFRRADVLAGLGRFGVVLIGAPGRLSSPLPQNLKAEQILYLAPYSERDVKVKELELAPDNARFGEPKSYEFTRMLPEELQTPGQPKPEAQIIHWTRVIHISDGMLDDNIFGQPRMERVWNRLDDLEKVVGGGSEAFWLRAHQGYQLDLDKDLQLDTTGEEDMDEEVDAFMHGISRIMRTRGVKMQALGSDVADFATNVESILGLIAAGTGIPQRILSGSERGQLASQQDRVNWAERVQDRRMEFAGPVILGQFVDRLIAHGVLPQPERYEVRWPQVFDLSDDERAIIAARWAEINQKMKIMTIKPNEIRDRILALPPLTEAEQIPLGPGGEAADPEPPVREPANPERSGER